MEMEMGMDSLWSHHQHPPPPLPPSSQVPDASSYYYYYPPFAAAAAATTDNPTPSAVSRSRASRLRAAVRKDRHSKICTAGGMRDRRMRLSMDVARRFFALQDKLGFDKASKTVQWLLDRSTAGINHLAASMSASMSLSEEDGDGSALLDLDNNDHAMAMVADAETNKQQGQEHQTAKAKRRSAPAAPRKKSNNGGAPVLLPDKASWARARQRARERTKERNRLWSEAPAPAPAPAGHPVVPTAACSNSYYEQDGEQEPWELGGVVFAKPRIQSKY